MSPWILLTLTTAGPAIAQGPPDRIFAAPRTDMVLRWNDVLLHAVRSDRTPPPRAARNLAIVHGAVYDAVNAIIHTHTPFLVDLEPTGTASAEAAAAAAAHRALVALYPGQQANLDAALAASLAEVPEAGRECGVQLGRAVAEAFLEWRRDDGSDQKGTHTPRRQVGLWEPTPPA